MKSKDNFNFWAGFFVTAVAVGWLYWLWQHRREVMPSPLVISTRKSAVSASDPKMPAPQRDDLTVIKGIGPVFATRLNKAGIYTYAQLAAQSPAKVQAVSQVSRWDPADWIAEAKRLS